MVSEALFPCILPCAHFFLVLRLRNKCRFYFMRTVFFQFPDSKAGKRAQPKVTRPITLLQNWVTRPRTRRKSERANVFSSFPSWPTIFQSQENCRKVEEENKIDILVAIISLSLLLVFPQPRQNRLTFREDLKLPGRELEIHLLYHFFKHSTVSWMFRIRFLVMTEASNNNNLCC